VELLSKDAKAVTRNMPSLDPKMLGNFLALVKSAINNSSVTVGAAPLADMKQYEFTADREIYSSWLHTTLGESGINSNLLFSGDVKPNALETQLSTNVDEMISVGIYPYFNSFLDYHINKRTSYYKFGFEFEGSNFFTNRQQRLDAQLKLLPFGIVNPQKIFAALGQSPFVAQAQLDEARANGWVANLTPVANSNTMGNAGGESAGRPTQDTNKLTDSGLQTRGDAANKGRGGK
jgi:hypothetical protein